MNTFANETEKQRQREEQAAKNGAIAFQKWIDRPETKLLLSMVPPAENQDAVAATIRSAFDFGFHCGQGESLSMIIDVMLKAPKKD